MTVILHAPTAHRFAAGHRASAEQATASAAALRGDLAPLLPAFGLIGAEFLTALAQVLDRAAHYQDDLGAHHRSIAAATDSGVEGYARTDSGAATRVGGLTGTGRR
ncbi:hypothetical protein GCM10010528_26280 [Gordonia defluvii]|jgi:hypothetical protein|uniref:ESX-1 secretion-associated protein n=1 Tax=Gordonia defluvii TaxID=283718 RepID=A0ABP6LNL4_9ACTN|nr:type VII secretion target [Gordonia sp. UBA5067]